MINKQKNVKDLPLIGTISGKLKVHFRKANNAYKKGNTEQAYNEIVNMQLIDPNDVNVNHLSAILLMQEQPAQVIFQYLNKAQTAAPEDMTIRKTYVDLLVLNGHIKEALKQQQFIVSKQQNNIDAWLGLLVIARKADDKVSLLEASSMLSELGHPEVFSKDIEYSLQSTFASQYKRHIEKALIHVFERKSNDLQRYMPHAARLLFIKYSNVECDEKNIQQLNDDVLLNTFLISGYNVHYPFESWLHKIRKILLIKISALANLDSALTLVQSIAIQGYLTGYVILPDGEENSKLEALESHFGK